MWHLMSIRLFCTKTTNKLILPKKILKEKAKGHNSQYFVDFKRIQVKAGKGGDGRVSFMHTAITEWAGPDGGDGGNGGHVIIKGCKNLKSLNKVQSLNYAKNGVDGRSCHMRGANAENLCINVPIGTQIKSTNGEDILDITKHEQIYVAAHGGAGGKGNYYFLTSDNKEPLQSTPGNQGEENNLVLELKIVADAALIGFPNVGKSSILNAVTRARSKIGDYSFTTLYPHVGIVEYEDDVQISIADLPGVITDSTRGLGTHFLRHLERTKILLLVVDLSLPNPYEQYIKVKDILELYDKDIFAKKSCILVGNKIDQKQGMDNLEKVRHQIDLPIVPISTTERINLTKFLIILKHIYDKL